MHFHWTPYILASAMFEQEMKNSWKIPGAELLRSQFLHWLWDVGIPPRKLTLESPWQVTIRSLWMISSDYQDQLCAAAVWFIVQVGFSSFWSSYTFRLGSNSALIIIIIIIIMIHLTAIGLTPGGSSTVHIYTQQYTEQHSRHKTIHRTIQFTN
jgi:hypothetical protein